MKMFCEDRFYYNCTRLLQPNPHIDLNIHSKQLLCQCNSLFWFVQYLPLHSGSNRALYELLRNAKKRFISHFPFIIVDLFPPFSIYAELTHFISHGKNITTMFTTKRSFHFQQYLIGYESRCESNQTNPRIVFFTRLLPNGCVLKLSHWQCKRHKLCL